MITHNRIGVAPTSYIPKLNGYDEHVDKYPDMNPHGLVCPCCARSNTHPMFTKKQFTQHITCGSHKLYLINLSTIVMSNKAKNFEIEANLYKQQVRDIQAELKQSKIMVTTRDNKASANQLVIINLTKKLATAETNLKEITDELDLANQDLESEEDLLVEARLQIGTLTDQLTTSNTQLETANELLTTTTKRVSDTTEELVITNEQLAITTEKLAETKAQNKRYKKAFKHL